MNLETPKNKAWPQYLAVTSVSLGTISAGTVIGWMSPSSIVLMNDDSPIPMSYDDLPKIIATTSVGLSLGSIFSAIFLDRIGRKPVILISSLFYIVSWLCVLIAENLALLHVSRLFAGLALGSSTGSILIYIGEIIEVKRRSNVAYLNVIFLYIGIIFESFIARLVSFSMLNSVSLIFPILFLLTFSRMPETPHFLVSKDMNVEAYGSIMWLRGQNKMKFVEKEIDDIKNWTRFRNKLDFFEVIRGIYSKRHRKSLILGLIILSGQQLSGMCIIDYFTESIFRQIDSPIDPSTAVVFLNSFTLTFILLTVFLNNIVERKTLLITSIFGTLLSYAVMATYMLLFKIVIIGIESAWIAVVGIFAFKFFISLGISSVPGIIVGELYPSEMRAWLSCLMITYQSIIVAIIVKAYQVVEEEIGIFVMFYIFACSLLVFAIFIIFCLQETKNRLLVDAQEILQGRNIPHSHRGHTSLNLTYLPLYNSD